MNSCGEGTAAIERYFAAVKHGRKETEQDKIEETARKRRSSRINSDLNVNVNDATMASIASRDNSVDDLIFIFND